MGAEALVRVVLAGEVVGEGARSERRGRPDGARGVALLGGEACGRVAVGAAAAVEDLGEVACCW